MKIEQRSCPGRLGHTTVQINRVGWGAAFLRKHKIENKIRSMKSFFSKKSFLGTMAVAAVCMLGTTNAQAQEFTIQGDLVSSYVWRGIYQGGAASFQPTLGFSVGNFSLTAWGSTSLSESNKEIDLTAAYKFGEAGPTLSVATLWWDGQADVANGELTNNYFHFKSGDTGHHFEAGLAYTLPIEKFPLSIAWYTMFAGADRKMTDKGEEKQAYSSYVELNYPFSVKGVDLNATCGVVPYETPQYNVNGFAVTNFALKATKALNFNERFSLPIFVQAIWNPRMEDAHLVFGVTLKP